MALEFTAVPPVPRGMNLAGPPVFIDDAYCRWMQDVLVDRPGQIRMRGPLSYWYDSTGSVGLDEGEQIIGAAETYIGNASGNPEWRGAVFVADGPTDSTLDALTSGNSSRVTASGFMRVFKNVSGTKSAIGEVLLPIPFNTQYNAGEKRWINNTIIDAKPALGGGMWIGVIDDVTNSTSSGTSALFYWRGAGLPETSGGSNAGWDVSGTTPNVITHASTVSGVEPGMFAFYGSRYLGIVASVSGANVTLEKNVLTPTINENNLSAKVAITYHSVRGFVHQYGRGFANYDGGAYLTSGGIGTDAEGLFKAARLTVGGGSASGHKAYVYRTSDHQYVARIKYGGTVSNTQVEVANGSGERPTIPGDEDKLLQNESYFIIRNDDTMYPSTDAYDTDYHPINLAYRRPDQKPGALTLTSNTDYAQPAPGIFNSTYAGRQWFASFNTSINTYDKNINRVVFSSTDNPENINLCQDAADSIIIPGRENIMGIAGSNAGLLVFVETKTYIIRGTNRQNFALEELYPDGCLSTSSIVQVGGGVIWAGKQGIYYFDGASVRNFTPEALGVYYTDGIKNFDLSSDRVYAFVFNNYLVIGFTKWFSNYTLRRWQGDGSFSQDNSTYTSITNTGNVNTVNPDRITFAIYLPTGSIGTLSNFTPRGYMEGIMATNQSTNNIAPPHGNSGTLMDLKSLFTENIDDQTLDGSSVPYWSNDSVYSTVGSGFSIRLNGPDFYMETKQYNFGETTLRKWWRKLMFNLSINQGAMMVEFVDINDNSLVSPVTNSNPAVYNTTDESGFYIIGSTTYPWSYYEDLSEAGELDWDDIENTPQTWLEYFAGVNVRYSRWLGIRKSSLGFRMYGLRGYDPDALLVTNKERVSDVSTLTLASTSALSVGDNIFVDIADASFNGLYRIKSKTSTTVSYDNDGSNVTSGSTTGTLAREVIPEIVNVNDWIWGLKPLRSGRN